MGSIAILGQIWARNRTFLFGGQICNSVDNHFYCLTLSLFRESNIAQLTGCPHPAECGVTMGLAVLKTYGMLPSEIPIFGIQRKKNFALLCSFLADLPSMEGSLLCLFQWISVSWGLLWINLIVWDVSVLHPILQGHTRRQGGNPLSMRTGRPDRSI